MQRQHIGLMVATGAVAMMTVLGFASAAAAGDDEVYSPYETPQPDSYVVDMHKVVIEERGLHVSPPVQQPDLAALGTFDRFTDAPDPEHTPSLPEGWTQVGEVVLPTAVAQGALEVSPNATEAFEDIPGNKYPRKHTVFLNFNGGKLNVGSDNSAENKSTLAKGQVYPTYGGSETSAIALAQAVIADVEGLGIRVMYMTRPSKTVPYTMAMIGGHYSDTTAGPSGGVAPGADCGARGQRHVVYAFGQAASSTVSQELAHAWGLDHIYGSDMIMSYQGFGNKQFATECRDLCEEGCQGAGSIGCRLVHDEYCGEGSEQQFDMAELGYIFGDDAPDTEAPFVDILTPEDGITLPPGSNLDLSVDVDDNYGGVGWKITIEHNEAIITDPNAFSGEVVFDQVDYDKALSWDLNNIPVGTYRITLEAEDHNDNISQDVITIFVAEEEVETTTTGDSDSGTDGSASDGS
ncbi:MAG: hypothetical protein KC636_33165, partial [Myxococcales bacterium]|nr:hypothetical protein [Myxococcales bacterium]